jgi:ATP-dependent protease ClpP protease subunit
MHNWFRFTKSANVADVFIYDFIGDWIDDYWGFGVTARSFIASLQDISPDTTTIRVHINSPGGDVFSALTIANALRSQRQEKGRTVEVLIEGLAASAASVVAMGGGSIKIADNALMMIHDPWGVVQGNARDMRQTAGTLDTIRDSVVASYRWHSTLPAETIRSIMADETYMGADDAITAGFATEKMTPIPVQKTFPAKVIGDLRIPTRFAAIARTLTSTPSAFAITKFNPFKKQVFGWASVAVSANGQPVVDAHQHRIDPQELEHAVYQFNLHHRELDANHTDPVEGQLIESLIVTPEKLTAMGLSQGSLPVGWWVGFQLVDDVVFAKVMAGEYTMFSISGTATLVPVGD